MTSQLTSFGMSAKLMVQTPVSVGKYLQILSMCHWYIRIFASMNCVDYSIVINKFNS